MRTQTVASYFRVRVHSVFVAHISLLKIVKQIVFPKFFLPKLKLPKEFHSAVLVRLLVLSDGPVVQDGGRAAPLCALYQTQ